MDRGCKIHLFLFFLFFNRSGHPFRKGALAFWRAKTVSHSEKREDKQTVAVMGAGEEGWIKAGKVARQTTGTKGDGRGDHRYKVTAS
ncbi:hypothetical protein CPAR01_15026 [Colletotrichum paranaense]|uniref:Secreted protein n=1 Tax=Colletotrichum paranaense TaxID=1914294 RepID=A0ABQ9S1Y7_9PEZI|nr:uncharacterized protein CPAR01_15026 [Colletotrichum paranaense]KAK1521503.1 hypothetical protein CPAR01_15026 [Colletotrichum paranaense]